MARILKIGYWPEEIKYVILKRQQKPPKLNTYLAVYPKFQMKLHS